MALLIVDTSTVKPLVVFAKEGKLLYNKPLPMGWQSSRYLSSAIEEGFDKLAITPADLQAVAVTIGPGSFTGIRVGVAMAKGMAYARALPLIGLCSLSGFVSPFEGRFASMIDARIGGAYVLIQEKNGSDIKPISDPMLISKENLNKVLFQCTWVVGPSLERFCLPNAIETYPAADALANIASNKLLQGEYSTDCELLYLRALET